MPFASLSDFNKWHKSIQYRYASSAGRKQTGATSPPFARCDITKGSRQPMAQREPITPAEVLVPPPSEPTPYRKVRYEWEAEE